MFQTILTCLWRADSGEEICRLKLESYQVAQFKLPYVLNVLLGSNLFTTSQSPFLLGF